MMYDIADLARFLLELSVIDYYFVIHRPSNIALAAIMNAIEEVCGRSSSSTYSSSAAAALPTLAAFTAELCRFGDGRLVDPHTEDVLQCRSRLQILYEHGGYATSNDDDDMASSSGVDCGEEDGRNETISSPVCVSHGLNNIQQAETWTKHSNNTPPLESERTADTTASGTISVAPFTESEEVTTSDKMEIDDGSYPSDEDELKIITKTTANVDRRVDPVGHHCNTKAIPAQS